MPPVPPAAKAGAGRATQGPVPVVAGTVAQKDVPIYLDGLGTVQAFLHGDGPFHESMAN